MSRIPRLLRTQSFFDFDDDDSSNMTATDTATITATNNSTATNNTATNNTTTNNTATNNTAANTTATITATNNTAANTTAPNTATRITATDATATNTATSTTATNDTATDITATDATAPNTATSITATNASDTDTTTAPNTTATEKVLDSGDYFPTAKITDSDDTQDLITQRNTLYNLGIKRVPSNDTPGDETVSSSRERVVRFKKTDSGNDFVEVFSIKPVFNTDNIGTFINEDYSPDPIDPNAPEPTREELFYENEFSILCTPTDEIKKTEDTVENNESLTRPPKRKAEHIDVNSVPTRPSKKRKIAQLKKKDSTRATKKNPNSNLEREPTAGSKRKREPVDEEYPNKNRKIELKK